MLTSLFTCLDTVGDPAYGPAKEVSVANSERAAHETHIHILAGAVLPHAGGGDVQICVFDEGVYKWKHLEDTMKTVVEDIRNGISKLQADVDALHGMFGYTAQKSEVAAIQSSLNTLRESLNRDRQIFNDYVSTTATILAALESPPDGTSGRGDTFPSTTEVTRSADGAPHVPTDTSEQPAGADSVGPGGNVQATPSAPGDTAAEAETDADAAVEAKRRRLDDSSNA